MMISNILSIVKIFISFIKSNWKSILICTIVVSLVFCYFKIKIGVLQNELNSCKNQIEILTFANTEFEKKVKDFNNILKIKDDTIESLKKSNNSIKETLDNEINIWKEKYNYCMDNKIEIIDKTGELDDKTNKFYIDMYNNRIFK